ncbi:hypothetical protein H4R27_005587 [Coemansia aciculifera]|nr:hypothetical protein H4R27_005587 [Coemansia aciculifera]
MQRDLLQTPKERQQWQKQWDDMTAAKEVLRPRLQEDPETEEPGTDAATAHHIRELALSRSNIPAPASSPDNILQLVFEYLSPVPGRGCSPSDLLAHLRCLQRVAAVSREWRAIALPLFYRTAYVIIGNPPDPLDDSDDYDENTSIEDDVSTSEYSDNSMSENGDVSMDENGGDDDIADEDVSMVEDDDEDEELLNTVGLSRNDVDIRLRTNIGQICEMCQTANAREVQIIVQGMGQIAGQILHLLQQAELDRHNWPAVERLRIDMRESSTTTQTNTTVEQEPRAIEALNDFLSQTLPSLHEIELYGPHSKTIYGCVLVEQLIKEWIYRPESLRAARIKSDCWPKLTDDYDTGERALPVYIECMNIDGPDKTYLMPAPMMVANTLAELKLTTVSENYEWSLFEYLGDLDQTEKEPDSSLPPPVFTSLTSLVLDFVSVYDHLGHRPENILPMESDEEREERDYHNWRRHNPGRGYFAYLEEQEESDSSDSQAERRANEDAKKNDNKLYLEDVQERLQSRFGSLPYYRKSKFPVLTRLEIRHTIHVRDLELFADSPISSLVIRFSPFYINYGLDLSIFRGLRSLSIRYTTSMDHHSISRVNSALSKVCPSLQHLTLGMTIHKNRQFRFTVSSFADSLVSLTFEGEYGRRDVEHFLQLLPNMRRLSVCAILSEPLFSASKAANKHRLMCSKPSWKPVNSLLRVLGAYGKRYFSDYDGWNSFPESRRLMIPELDHYRGILVSLVCRLPALDMLRVGSQSVYGVNESTSAIIDTNVGPRRIGRLKRLRVRPLDYQG